jgi:prepilin-type N-terminal cleavage/methylation domain-containing protein
MPSSSRPRGESGFTLIEILVTLVIMTTAFAILVGGTMTGVVVSNNHREKADGEIVLRQFADYVKAKPFHACPLPDPPDSGSYIPTDDWADGFSLTTPECTLISPGIQKVRLNVEPENANGAADPNARLTVEIVKRG